jgi:nitrous oxidase accessory protein
VRTRTPDGAADMMLRVAVATLVLLLVVAAPVAVPAAGPARPAAPAAERAGAVPAHAAGGSAATTARLAAAAEQRELVVGDGERYASIGAALLDARNGDLVRVRAGTYAEAGLTIAHSIELVGEAGAVLQNSGTAGLLHVVADGVTIRGMTLRGAASSHVRDHAAILVENATGCIIERNQLADNFFGIYLAKATDCRVADNTIEASGARESSSGNGIHLWSSSGADISGNVIRGHRDGIYLEHVRGATLRGNVSEDNLRYGLHFMFSNENRYIGNTFRRNGAGVAVMYSKDVLVRGNTFEDNWGATAYGLLIKDIYDSVIEDNTFRRNTVGISSEGSTRVEVRGNRFVRNGWAARVLASSQENRFTGNSFIENTFDVTTNSRRNYNTFDGNYWSRYSGYDLTGDGIGDVPHRPVRLFALLVQRTPAALVLLRSAFLDVLEVAERVAPVLTPETLVDENPLMREVAR